MPDPQLVRDALLASPVAQVLLDEERHVPRASVSRLQDIVEGVRWRDPEQLQQWIGELSKSEPVVVYCAYGFHVGCKTAIKLREAGFDAKYMNSGHYGWKAVGHPLRPNM